MATWKVISICVLLLIFGVQFGKFWHDVANLTPIPVHVRTWRHLAEWTWTFFGLLAAGFALGRW
jgi:hypothetical protein